MGNQRGIVLWTAPHSKAAAGLGAQRRHGGRHREAAAASGAHLRAGHRRARAGKGALFVCVNL
eukprot:6214458-Pleurochrysis_carterae.AAC.6